MKGGGSFASLVFILQERGAGVGSEVIARYSLGTISCAGWSFDALFSSFYFLLAQVFHAKEEVCQA